MESLQISQEKLSETTKAAIRYLVYEEGMTQTEIGQRIGYPDGQMVGKVLKDEAFFGALPLANLSRLASERGFDELADVFSAPAKAAVPVVAGKINYSLREELRKVVENLGGSSEAYHARRFHDAETRARLCVAGSMELLDEVLAAKHASL